MRFYFSVQNCIVCVFTSILDGRLGLLCSLCGALVKGSFCIVCIGWLCVICDAVSPLIITLLMGSVVGVRAGKAVERHTCKPSL